MEENRRLRTELEELRDQAYDTPAAAAVSSAGDDEQKLELYGRLEKAESRILSLERQVRVAVDHRTHMFALWLLHALLQTYRYIRLCCYWYTRIACRYTIRCNFCICLFANS